MGNKENLKKYQKELLKLESSSKVASKDLEEKNKDLSKQRRKAIELAKELQRKQKQIINKRTKLAEVEVDRQHNERSLVSLQKKVILKEKEEKEHQEEIKEVQRRLKSVKQESEKYEKQLKAVEKKEIKLVDKQLDEYNSLKNQAGTQTVNLTQELDTINVERETDKSDEARLDQKISQLKGRQDQLNTALITHEGRIEKLEEILGDASSAVKNLDVKKQRLTRKVREGNDKKQTIESELLTIRNQLRDAAVDKRETEREARFKDALESMKRLFKGVKGKLGDLCKISREKYNVPVTVVLGRNVNSIVVDTEETAVNCIQYLKEQRIKKTTFIPLETIKTARINESFRRLGRDRKLAIDVVTFDEQYYKAFVYAVGNTVICKGLDDAMELCYNRKDGQKIKAVTLDGTVINKAGLMTGGLADVKKVMKKFNEKEISNLKKKRDELIGELQIILREESSYTQQLNIIQRETQSTNNRIKYTTVDYDFTKTKILSLAKEKDTIALELGKSETEIAKVKKSLSKVEKKISIISEKIKAIEDKIFSTFSRKIGVDNIREYENTFLKEQQEAIRKRSNFKILISRFESKLDYEQNRDFKGPLKKYTSLIEKRRKNLGAIKNNENKIKGELEGLIEDEKEKKKQAKKFRVILNDKDTAISETKKGLHEISKKLQRAARNVAIVENQNEQFRNRRKEICLKCKVEEIDLPRAEDEPRKKKRRPDESESDDEMDVREEDSDYLTQTEPFSISQSEADEMSQGSQSSVRSREDYEEVTIDFSLLQKRTLNLSDEAYDKLDSEYKGDLINLTKQISELSPSLKSIEKLRTVEKKLSETTQNVNSARVSSKSAIKKFEAIKKKRYDAFMNAFDSITQSIDQIYKDLTKSQKYPLGGSAYLNLEDIEEPYLQGVKYITMPPMKRYRDMDELSGGEKSVSALALLFAIQGFKKSPFFILDEVDAALDNVNVNKVANYIKSKSKDTQFLVISLKDTFYSKADTLVGIYRDTVNKCSKTLSFDLRPFEKKKSQK